jgi:uncharacterized surface protein with fasciclin (FAS1) repeats
MKKEALMKKLALSMVALIALAAAPVFAHCGSCGMDGKHASAAKGECEHAKRAYTSDCGDKDLVAVAMGADDFTTLVAAVKKAGLVETLQGDGPYTVFAPTNEAFAKLPEGTVENLLANPEKLKQVLLYHVVPGKVTAEKVAKLDKATTAQGTDVAIKLDGDRVMVNEAQVVKSDVMASNGVIHVIDTVIVPAG